MMELSSDSQSLQEFQQYVLKATSNMTGIPGIAHDFDQKTLKESKAVLLKHYNRDFKKFEGHEYTDEVVRPYLDYLTGKADDIAIQFPDNADELLERARKTGKMPNTYIQAMFQSQ